jgi:sigma-B regulation protein RsbU (phosphoserine phosphatase)
MDPVVSITLLALVAVGLSLWVRKRLGRLAESRRELAAVAGEEQRMFDFLHTLGTAIEGDQTRRGLYRVIVDGVSEVIDARGGALYLLSDDRRHLVPRYLSENCPPLVGVPVEVQRKAKHDPRALDSHLRLAQVAIDDGVLGHCLGLGEALHVPDLKLHGAFRDSFTRYEGDVAALLAPLRHAGKDLGVLAMARGSAQGPFSTNDFAVFRSLAEQSGFALGNAIIHEEAHEKRKLDDELRTAREVQSVLLPAGEPVVPGFRVCGTNLPARIISGDYYDFLDLGEGRHGIVIADVSGKGVPAGLLMAMCRSVLRSVAPGESSPAKVLAAVNRLLFPDIREDMFISMIYALIEDDSGRVVLARAGHDAPLWFHKLPGEVATIKPPGLAVGIDDGEVFERITRDQEIRMAPGDCLLLVTDGVREALDEAEQEFGHERVQAVFGKAATLGAQAAVEGLARELRSFVGGAPQMDDITMIAVEKR